MTGANLNVDSWRARALSCWIARERPGDELVLRDFTYDAVEKGVLLIGFREFDIDPDSVRKLSVAFAFLRAETMDYFLLSFLSGNLSDRSKADVSVRLAAQFILRGSVEELRRRFSIEELRLIEEYFSLIANFRGWALDAEDRAHKLVSSALADG